MDLISFLPRAVMQGIPLLYGSTGEILTEKSGNLNLGIPGIMYVGGICGVIGAFFYEQSTPVASMNGLLAVGIPMLCSLLGSLLMGLLYCLLTVTLRANQNVTGLAMTTFGVGFGNFFGGSLIKLTGADVPSIALSATSSYFRRTLPFADKTGVVGQLLFSYGFLAYLAIAIALIASYVLGHTRVGLHLRAVGENPATADAAGINIGRYKYVATIIGSMVWLLERLYSCRSGRKRATTCGSIPPSREGAGAWGAVCVVGAAGGAAAVGGDGEALPPIVAESCWAICMIWAMLLGSDSSAFSFSSNSAMPRTSSHHRCRDSSRCCTSAAPSGVAITRWSMADSADMSPAAACCAARPSAAVSPPDSIPNRARPSADCITERSAAGSFFNFFTMSCSFTKKPPPQVSLTETLYVAANENVPVGKADRHIFYRSKMHTIYAVNRKWYSDGRISPADRPYPPHPANRETHR